MNQTMDTDDESSRPLPLPSSSSVLTDVDASSLSSSLPSTPSESTAAAASSFRRFQPRDDDGLLADTETASFSLTHHHHTDTIDRSSQLLSSSAIPYRGNEEDDDDDYSDPTTTTTQHQQQQQQQQQPHSTLGSNEHEDDCRLTTITTQRRQRHAVLSSASSSSSLAITEADYVITPSTESDAPLLLPTLLQRPSQQQSTTTRTTQQRHVALPLPFLSSSITEDDYAPLPLSSTLRPSPQQTQQQQQQQLRPPQQQEQQRRQQQLDTPSSTSQHRVPHHTPSSVALGDDDDNVASTQHRGLLQNLAASQQQQKPQLQLQLRQQQQQQQQQLQQRNPQQPTSSSSFPPRHFSSSSSSSSRTPLQQPQQQQQQQQQQQLYSNTPSPSPRDFEAEKTIAMGKGDFIEYGKICAAEGIYKLQLPQSSMCSSSRALASSSSTSSSCTLVSSSPSPSTISAASIERENFQRQLAAAVKQSAEYKNPRKLKRNTTHDAMALLMGDFSDDDEEIFTEPPIVAGIKCLNWFESNREISHAVKIGDDNGIVVSGVVKKPPLVVVFSQSQSSITNNQLVVPFATINTARDTFCATRSLYLSLHPEKIFNIKRKLDGTPELAEETTTEQQELEATMNSVVEYVQANYESLDEVFPDVSSSNMQSQAFVKNNLNKMTSWLSEAAIRNFGECFHTHVNVVVLPTAASWLLPQHQLTPINRQQATTSRSYLMLTRTKPPPRPTKKVVYVHYDLLQPVAKFFHPFNDSYCTIAPCPLLPLSLNPDCNYFALPYVIRTMDISKRAPLLIGDHVFYHMSDSVRMLSRIVACYTEVFPRGSSKFPISLVGSVSKTHGNTPLSLDDHVVHRFLSCLQKKLVDTSTASSSSSSSSSSISPLAGWLKEPPRSKPQQDKVWQGNPVIKFNNLVKAIERGDIDEVTKTILIDDKMMDAPENVYNAMYSLLSSESPSSASLAQSSSSSSVAAATATAPAAATTATSSSRRKRTVELISASAPAVKEEPTDDSSRRSVRVQKKETQTIIKQKDAEINDLLLQLASKQSLLPSNVVDIEGENTEYNTDDEDKQHPAPTTKKARTRARSGRGRGRGRSTSSLAKPSGSNTFVRNYSTPIKKIVSQSIISCFGSNMIQLANNIKTGMQNVYKYANKFMAPLDAYGVLYEYLTTHRDAAAAQFKTAPVSAVSNIARTIDLLLLRKNTNGTQLVNPEFDINNINNIDYEGGGGSSFEEEQEFEGGSQEHSYDGSGSSSSSSTPSYNTHRTSHARTMSQSSLFSSPSYHASSYHRHGTPFPSQPQQHSSSSYTLPSPPSFPSFPPSYTTPQPTQQHLSPQTQPQQPSPSTTQSLETQINYLIQKEKKRDEEEVERKRQELLKQKKAELDAVQQEFDRLSQKPSASGGQ